MAALDPDRKPVNIDDLRPFPKCFERWIQNLITPDPILQMAREDVPPGPRCQPVWITRYVSSKTGYRREDVRRVYEAFMEALPAYFRYAGNVRIDGVCRVRHVYIPEHYTGTYKQKLLTERTRMVFRPDMDMLREVASWRPYKNPQVTYSHYVKAMRRRDFMANIDMVRMMIDSETKTLEYSNNRAKIRRDKKRAARALADRKLKEKVLTKAQKEWDKEKEALLAQIADLQSKLTSSESTGSSPKTS